MAACTKEQSWVDRWQHQRHTALTAQCLSALRCGEADTCAERALESMLRDPDACALVATCEGLVRTCPREEEENTPDVLAKKTTPEQPDDSFCRL